MMRATLVTVLLVATSACGGGGGDNGGDGGTNVDGALTGDGATTIDGAVNPAPALISLSAGQRRILERYHEYLQTVPGSQHTQQLNKAQHRVSRG